MSSKMAEALSRQLDQAAPDQRVRVIVRYSATPTAAALRGAKAANVTTYQLVPFVALDIAASDVRALADSPDVEQVWPDLPVHIWLDESVPLIEAPQVWAAGFRGQGVTVAVVDTGIDLTHPDLTGRVAKTQDFSGEGFQDNHGHGTHVAGIIGGNGTASSGRYKGVAPEVIFMAAKVLKGNGSGNTSDVMAGVDWAATNGAQVINLSLGSDGSCDGTDPLSQMCDAAVAKGVVVCVAAGNAGPDSKTVGSPGCAKTVITVAACDKSDQMASFSSRGPTADGRLKPDITFPGVNIASCRAQGTSMGQAVDDYYTRASGTSMATPHCTGSAALLLCADATRSPQTVKDLLMNSAKDLQTDVYAQGRGRAQVYKALLGQVTPPPPTPPPTPPPPPSNGSGCSGNLPQFLQRMIHK